MSESSETPPRRRAVSTALRAAWVRVRRTPMLGPRLTHLGMLLAISIAASFAISPGLYGQQTPPLRSEDLGKPFSSPSPAGFKANRDYQIQDQSLTEQRRQEARAAVRPVFDFNPTLVTDLKQSISDSFGTMREALERAEKDAADNAPPPGKSTEPAKKKAPDFLQLKDVLPVLNAREAFEQKLFALEDEDFDALLTARFSREVELATAVLVEHAYLAPVATSRDELTQVGAQGLTLRDLGEGNERMSTAGTPGVNDVREAKNELERFASLPGNLLPDSSAALRRAVLRLAKRQVRPNLTINTAETEARRVQAARDVKDAVVEIKRGQKVIGDGELISERHLFIIRGMRGQTDRLDLFQLQLGGMGLVALIVGAAYAFHRAAFRRFRPTRKDAFLLGILLTGMLALLHLWVSIGDAIHDRYPRIPVEALELSFPIAAGAMLVRFMLTEELALFFGIVLACLSGVMLGNSLSFAIYALVGSLVAADRITRAKDRVGIFRAALVTGVINFLTVIMASLAEGKGVHGDSWIAAAFALVGTTLGAPILVMAFTPLIEAGFGYASDIKLLELANLNHPALKELIVQSPGTYHHSIIVGSLVEGAAEAIGANPLLARSCAYYHDIGKGKNPLYFGENQKGENRHDTLAPAMSAVIIKRHVTDGMEMARQYKLPRLVADAIPQHHGTRVVGFFYHKALREQEGKEGAPPVDDSIYRYPGPKPQFREAALVMIADAVEASSRSLPDVSTAKLQQLVQKIINVIFSEGQLDECDLTLKDLNSIAQSFLRTLEGIYHARPEYPPAAMSGPRPAPPLPVPPTLTVAPRPGEPKRTGSS